MTLTVEQQRIVEENLGLVRAVLSRCVSSPGSTGIYSYDDLFQIGCIALCEAVIEYQPGRAVFSTYAFAAIRNRIYNALARATYCRKREKQSDFPSEPVAVAPWTLRKPTSFAKSSVKLRIGSKALPVKA